MTMPQNVDALPESALTYDEVSMQKSQDFFMALQELKNLKPQLYSAAEYCESSYIYSDQKHTVLENLKGYTVKALVNAVDHLGTVAYKLNDLLSQQSSELASADVRVSLVSQQLLACQGHTHVDALNQQVPGKEFKRYHKHYTFPDPNVFSPEDSSNEAQSTMHGGLPKVLHTHPPLEVTTSEDANSYYSRKSIATKTHAILHSNWNKPSLKQETGGQDEEVGMLSCTLEAKGQTESKPAPSQLFQESRSSASLGKTGIPSTAPTSTMPKSRFTTPLVQHSKSFIDEKRSLSSLMSFEESNQLQQNHIRSKSVLFSLLGKKRGTKQSKKGNT